MNHYYKHFHQGDVITIDSQDRYYCEFFLMSLENFKKFRTEKPHHSVGGNVQYYPSSITVPKTGNWVLWINPSIPMRYSLKLNSKEFF